LTGVRFAEIARDVRGALGQNHRYAHVVRVARLAGRLAHRHGEDPARARLAGLLHDLARLYSAERLVAECESREMPIDAFERRNPIVLHARLGAALARERFGIDDPGILSAICRHTVAAERMSRLDAIVYLADGLEPGRHFAEREGLLALAFRDLDAALAGLLRSTLAFLEKRNLETAPPTVAALAHLEALERTPLSA
jgi:predicted HD superfamily hydrolase involved in NAD metabolism